MIAVGGENAFLFHTFFENTKNLSSCGGLFALKMVSIIIVLVSLKNEPSLHYRIELDVFYKLGKYKIDLIHGGANNGYHSVLE